MRRPPTSPAPRPHFTSYAGSQTHGAVACKACAQDTKHKEALAEGRSQGARNVYAYRLQAATAQAPRLAVSTCVLPP